MSWLEDADSAWNLRESLARQMAKVVKETKESHVQIFGDTSFASDFAGSFEGDAQDKHGYLRGDAKTQVRTGVDARSATLSYLGSKAKHGLPGAREAYLAAREQSQQGRSGILELKLSDLGVGEDA